MKKKYLTISVAVALASSMTFTSCIGSFSLTNKLLSWNHQVGDKLINEVVFFAFWILPVYEVTALADVLVLNSIEFWSGNNPIAKGKKVIQGENDRYLVECDGRGYTITGQKDKRPVRLDFKADQQAWEMTFEGETVTLFTFVDDTHIKVASPEGGFTEVELSPAGLYAYQSMVARSQFAAR